MTHPPVEERLGLYVILVAAGAAACANPRPQAVTVSGTPTHLECPAHDSNFVVIDTVDGRQVARVFPAIPVAGPISSVPEYHDCQRLTLGHSPRFGPLVGIYAAQNLDSAFRDSARSEPAPPSRAAAEILSFDAPYPKLRIDKGFNCLYIWRVDSTRWEARIKPVGLDADKCLDAFTPAGAFPLRIKQISHDLTGAHVPPVARWDWDPVNLHHYIGIKCGDSWCEIGNQRSSGRHSADTMPPTRPVPGKPPAPEENRRRVVEIKGWYDEQRLAVPLPDGSLEASDLVGTVIPHPSLGELNDDADFATWAPVATVTFNLASTDYKSKMNFDQKQNGIELCTGPRESCIPEGATSTECKRPSDGSWWARITSAGGDTTYMCVVRHLHTGAPPPATARWRWLEEDETTWIRCPGGCCTLER